jgi:hypothetical protein
MILLTGFRAASLTGDMHKHKKSSSNGSNGRDAAIFFYFQSHCAVQLGQYIECLSPSGIAILPAYIKALSQCKPVIIKNGGYLRMQHNKQGAACV